MAGSLPISAGPAAAQAIKMRVADHYPAGHPLPTTSVKPFMEEVKKAVGPAIDFEYYPAEQLGKGRDMLALTQAGVIDIGGIVPSFVSDKMPLSAVAELPGGYATSCAGTKAFYALMTSGMLARKEFAPNGIHVLIAHAYVPYQVYTTKPVKGVADFAGMKLRSLGPVTDITIKKLGAVPVRVPTPEINEALSRGTMDGALLIPQTVLSFDLRSLRSRTAGENFGGATMVYGISETNWKKLSPQMQAAMTSAGQKTSLQACEAADASMQAQLGDVAKLNVEPVTLSATDKAALAVKLAEVGKEWADGLDKRGKAGTETLQAVQAALAGN
jgi:TRAP-type C4-dicarboxylate transport system substrate-binding protein